MTTTTAHTEFLTVPTVTTTKRGFLGQTEDPTGLAYLNARFYDPTIGQFLSVDPLVAKTGDPYLYGGGRPSSSVDPAGLSPWGFDDWLLNMFFGSLVHSAIQADYMQTYGDTYAEVSYSAFDSTDGTVSGRIDLAAFDPAADQTGDPRNLGLNEIRPDRAGAERVLEQREFDIFDGRATTLKVPYQPEISGAWRTYRDARPYDHTFDLLGVSVHAKRDGAGVITYSYGLSDSLINWRTLLPVLRDMNEKMREARGRNVASNQAAFDSNRPVEINRAQAVLKSFGLVVGATIAVVAAPEAIAGAAVVGGVCVIAGECRV